MSKATGICVCIIIAVLMTLMVFWSPDCDAHDDFPEGSTDQRHFTEAGYAHAHAYKVDGGNRYGYWAAFAYDADEDGTIDLDLEVYDDSEDGQLPYVPTNLTDEIREGGSPVVNVEVGGCWDSEHILLEDFLDVDCISFDDEPPFIVDVTESVPPPVTRSPPQQRSTSTTYLTETLPEIILPDPDAELPTPDDTSAIDDPEEKEIAEIVKPVPMVRFEYGQWYKGFNLVSFPVMIPEIVTIADFYNHYSFMESPDDILYVHIDGCWFPYNGQPNQIAGDVIITPYLGILAIMDWSAWWALTGRRIVGDGSVELTLGLNLMGLTELSSRYQVPSDFLKVDGIEAVLTTGKWDAKNKINTFYVIGRAGDEGDNLLYLGQAVMLIVSEGLTLDLSVDVARAPSVKRRGTLITSWGAMK